MKKPHTNQNVSKRFNYKRGRFWKSIIGLSIASSFFSPQVNAFPFGKKTGKAVCSKIHVGTQDQVINTAVGGAVVRELEIFKDNLPTDGEYKGLKYDLEWSSYTSGPPITNKMVANQIPVSYTHLTLPTTMLV